MRMCENDGIMEILVIVTRFMRKSLIVDFDKKKSITLE